MSCDGQLDTMKKLSWSRLFMEKWVVGFSIVCVLLLCAAVANAQQIPQYTMNMFDKYRSNPAYGGMEATLHATLTVKSQWESFPGAPKFQNVSVHAPFYRAMGGVGMQIYHDALGVEETYGFQASYNYVYESAVGLFSGGIYLGLIQKRLDGSRLRAPGGLYEGFLIQHNDPILSNTLGNAIGSTLGAGLYFANDFLEAGISVDHLPAQTLMLNNEEMTNVTLRRHWSGFVEYTYVFSELLEIKPSVFVKTDGTQLQLDFGARGVYQGIYLGGVSLRGYSRRTIDALAFFAGVKVSPQITIAYGYDATLSGLRDFSEGTHEFMLTYNLGKPVGVGRPERIIYNPRF